MQMVIKVGYALAIPATTISPYSTNRAPRKGKLLETQVRAKGNYWYPWRRLQDGADGECCRWFERWKNSALSLLVCGPSCRLDRRVRISVLPGKFTQYIYSLVLLKLRANFKFIKLSQKFSASMQGLNVAPTLVQLCINIMARRNV